MKWLEELIVETCFATWGFKYEKFSSELASKIMEEFQKRKPKTEYEVAKVE